MHLYYSVIEAKLHTVSLSWFRAVHYDFLTEQDDENFCSSIQVAAPNSSWWGIQMWYIALGTKALMVYSMFTLVYYMYYSKTIIDRLGLFQWDEQLIIILYKIDKMLSTRNKIIDASKLAMKVTELLAMRYTKLNDSDKWQHLDNA